MGTSVAWLKQKSSSRFLKISCCRYQDREAFSSRETWDEPQVPQTTLNSSELQKKLCKSAWWAGGPRCHIKSATCQDPAGRCIRDPLDPPPRLREYRERGWEEVRARGWQSCRGKGAGFWTAEDHCKHALIGAAVTCAVQVSRHPIRVGRGSCGPTLAGDSCQWKERWCSSEVPPLAGEPWRAALTLPSTTKKKRRNKKLNCLRNKTKRSWDGDTVKWDVLEAVGGGREILSNIW